MATEEDIVRGLAEMLPPALMGVRAKLERGAEHLKQLRSECEAFEAMPPFTVMTEIRDGRRLLVAEVTEDPPVRISVIFGELVNACNSALDHLAWSFATPQTAHDERLIKFVISSTAESFSRDEERLGGLLPPPILGDMKRFQRWGPGIEGGELLGTQLAEMRKLSNREKHRTLLVAAAMVRPGELLMGSEGQPIKFWDQPTEPEGRRAILDPSRAKLGKPQFWASVALDEPDIRERFLLGTAGLMWRATVAVVKAFEPRFSMLTA